MSKTRKIPVGVAWVLVLLAGSGFGWVQSGLAGSEPVKAARSPLGSWHWFNGKTVEFKANGQTEASNGMKGRWTGGNAVQNIVVKWENGATDTLGFSADNLRLYNVNPSADDTIGERIVPVAGSGEVMAATLLPKSGPGGSAGGKGTAAASPVPVDLLPIGVWHWFNDQTVTFKRTGEIEASGGWRGKWYVSVSGNREVAILWDGNPPDIVTLSPDRKRLANSTVSAELIEGDGAHPGSTPMPAGTTKRRRVLRREAAGAIENPR